MSELKPCPFCGEGRDRIMEAFMDGFAKIIEADGNYALSVEDNDATTSLIFNINNCPICGRPLDRRAQPSHIGDTAAMVVQPANEPLTLEQLREMAGEEIYVTRKMVIVFMGDRVLGTENRDALDFKDYGKTWLAYRRKPEGSENDG